MSSSCTPGLNEAPTVAKSNCFNLTAGVFSFGLLDDFLSLRSRSRSRSLDDNDDDDDPLPLVLLLVLPDENIPEPSSLPGPLLPEDDLEFGELPLAADFSADMLGFPPPDPPPETCFGEEVP